jgi:hypothetical protein
MEELDFETWSKLLEQELKNRGIHQPLTAESLLRQYELEKSPSDAADEFTVQSVYALLKKRDMDASLRGYQVAVDALPYAKGAASLALNEAVVQTLSNLFDELGEHGLKNQALWRTDLSSLNIQALSEQCLVAWQEVERLRNAGIKSEPLIHSYISDWILPIGSLDWIKAMRLAIKHYQSPEWLTGIIQKMRDNDQEE